MSSIDLLASGGTYRRVYYKGTFIGTIFTSYNRITAKRCGSRYVKLVRNASEGENWLLQKFWGV